MLSCVAAGERPDIVHVVAEIPVGRSYRPNAAELKQRPDPDAGGAVLVPRLRSRSVQRLTKAVVAEHFVGRETTAEVVLRTEPGETIQQTREEAAEKATVAY